MSWVARVRGSAINAYLNLAQRGGEHRTAEFYFQPSDPYSYLLAQLVPGLRTEHDAKVTVEAVASLDPALNPEPALRAEYAMHDCAELARYYELEFPERPVAPSADTIARATAEVMRGADPVEIGRLVWTSDGSALRAVGAEEQRRLSVGRQRLRRRGHYMGGMVRVGRQWCWGIDRLHYAERALGGVPRLLRRRPRSEWPGVENVTGLDFYFSFRSPYSYLALERTLALPTQIRIKPVLPMVMRGLKVPRAKRLYIVHDAKREADRLGIPFGHICDPLGVGVERCLGVFGYAEAEGRAGDFLLSAGRGIWSEALDVARDPDMRRIVERAGLSWSKARDAIADPGWRERAEENRKALFAEGMWGVPSYRLGNYRSWGQDRIWMLEAKLGATAS